MSWIALIVAGVLEAVWATALGASHGFSRPVPTLVFVLGLVLSMLGLAFALRTIPVGTGYAVWVGIGAALTVGFAMLTGAESFSILKAVLLLALVACVIGLKPVSSAH